MLLERSAPSKLILTNGSTRVRLVVPPVLTGYPVGPGGTTKRTLVKYGF